MRQLIKPYLVQNTSLIMSIFPIKGRYQKKNDFRAVMKVGAVVLEFIPKIKDNSDKNVRKTIFITVKMRFFSLMLLIGAKKIISCFH